MPPSEARAETTPAAPTSFTRSVDFTVEPPLRGMDADCVSGARAAGTRIPGLGGAAGGGRSEQLARALQLALERGLHRVLLAGIRRYASRGDLATVRTISRAQWQRKDR